MPTSRRVQQIEAQLRQRIATGADRPGGRFASARQIVRQHGISYQTAHRLLSRLHADGLIERRSRSGSFVRGNEPRLVGVWLAFSPRCRRPQSFGARLRTVLKRTFSDHDIDQIESIDEDAPEPPMDRLPVLWETPAVQRWCETHHRPAVVLNDRPTPGQRAARIDSVSCDDFAGGAIAGDAARACSEPDASFVVLAGPPGDRRSDERVAGFRSRIEAEVIHAGGWYQKHGRTAAQRVSALTPTTVFAANDRLAQGLLSWFRQRQYPWPRIIGYDNAPVAQSLGLTTVAIPWVSMANAVVECARSRLKHPHQTARTLLLQPSLELRTSTLAPTDRVVRE